MAIYPLDSVICPLYNWAQICKLDTFLFTFMRVTKCDLWMIKLKNDVPPLFEMVIVFSFLAFLNMTKLKFFYYLFLLFQVVSIAELLNTLPMYSSAVITSADSLITELFTHNGMPW